MTMLMQCYEYLVGGNDYRDISLFSSYENCLSMNIDNSLIIIVIALWGGDENFLQSLSPPLPVSCPLGCFPFTGEQWTERERKSISIRGNEFAEYTFPRLLKLSTHYRNITHLLSSILTSCFTLTLLLFEFGSRRFLHALQDYLASGILELVYGCCCQCSLPGSWSKLNNGKKQCRSIDGISVGGKVSERNETERKVIENSAKECICKLRKNEE